jgi:hypothetical protein
MSRRQLESVILTVIIISIIGVMVYFAAKPSAGPKSGYIPKTVNTKVEAEVLKNPQYQNLTAPAKLPVEAVPTGRANPFEPI